MKLFNCNNCGQSVYFENYVCLKCNAALGFDPQQMDMIALKEGEQLQEEPKGYIAFANDKVIDENAAAYKYCSNKQYHVCNWLLPYNSEAEFCIACNLNHTIPNLSTTDHLEKWARIEVAKHRLVYSLLRFQLPLISKFQDEDKGLAFDFMADEDAAHRLLTGHSHGLITLNIAEADDVIIEMARNQMDEVYRTLLGHFRHEVGHYYWERLINDTDNLLSFRNIFGDETADYGEALKQHYSKTASDDWKENFISAYAASHPWEDWAETWAHYLHIVDTLETGYSFGLKVKPRVTNAENELNTKLDIDPYTTKNFDNIIDRWLPLSFVMNSLNRSMGLKDSYPFVITDAVKEKLGFIHEMIRGGKM